MRLAKRAVLCALVTVAYLPLVPTPVDACLVGCGEPEATEDGFYTDLRTTVHALNNGGSASGGPPPCSEEHLFVIDPDDPDDEEQHTGHLAYVEPINEQDTLSDISGDDDGVTGTYWRLICVFEDGYEPVDDLVSIDFFPEVTPSNLARLAVDDGLARVPAPEVHLNPTHEQLVNVETWLWVDGIATTEFSAPPVSVPGTTVVVTVHTSGVYWDMGDGTTFQCDGTGVAYGEAVTPTCSHTYARSSAEEPGLEFQGTASVRWTATYTVNGHGPYTVDDAVVRETTFSVPVFEAQAVNT